MKFLIDADHGQFYIQDLEPYDAWMADHATDPDLPPAGWTEEAVHVHRIGVEPHSITLRGEEGARGEWRLLAACHNLRKIFRHVGNAGTTAAIA